MDDVINITKMSTVIDNWGRTIKTSNKKEIIKFLTTPEAQDDDTVFYESQNGVIMGCWDLDDLIGKEVMVGDKKIIVVG